MTGAGIVAGLIYWMIAGRNAGAWRKPRRGCRTAAGFAAGQTLRFPAFSSPSRSAKPPP